MDRSGNLSPGSNHELCRSGSLVRASPLCAKLDYEDIIPKRIPIFEGTRIRQEAENYACKLSAKWKCVIIRVTPQRVASFDYSKSCSCEMVITTL